MARLISCTILFTALGLQAAQAQSGVTVYEHPKFAGKSKLLPGGGDKLPEQTLKFTIPKAGGGTTTIEKKFVPVHTGCYPNFGSFGMASMVTTIVVPAGYVF